MGPSVVDFELLEPDPQPNERGRARTIVWFDGRPLGVLRELPVGSAAETAPAERALSELWPELAAALAARRLTGAEQVELPSATVVVCTRDRADLLEGCLAALAAQSHAPSAVVVVDNASRGHAVQRVARACSATYVREPRPGLDWARNRGVGVARSEIVVFTDDDARPEPGWLAALLRGFASPDIHAVTGLVLPVELETPAQLLFEDAYGGMGKGFELQLHAQGLRRPAYRPERVGVGCNMAFRRDALIAAGGFDPALDVGTATGGGGDLDVFQRLLESGAVIAYRPEAVVRHLHRSSSDALRRQLFDNGRGYSAMLGAAFLRTRGAERRLVVSRYVRWLLRWHAWRLARSLSGREALPVRLVAAETVGASLGPFVYLRARRTASRLASKEPGTAQEGGA